MKNKIMKKKKEEYLNRWLPIHAHYGNPPADITEDLWSWISTNFVPKEEVERVRDKLWKDNDPAEDTAQTWEMGYNEALNDILKELQDRKI